MRAKNYCAHQNTRDHWMLRCMNRCPDLVVCLKRDLKCLRHEATLVLIYRPNVAGMKGRVDLAQPVNRTTDLWCIITFHIDMQEGRKSDPSNLSPRSFWPSIIFDSNFEKLLTIRADCIPVLGERPQGY
ncbi:hypothetical protein TNCV_628481 [Trichonephila clavipes]|nr:hypothetical protein TNCV_628481 [Trichonephila clavipes]